MKKTNQQYQQLLDEINSLGYLDHEQAMKRARDIAERMFAEGDSDFGNFLEAEVLFYNEEPERAFRKAKECLSALKHVPAVLSNYATLLAYFERYEEAIELLDAVLEEVPNMAHALLSKAVSLVKLGRIEESLEYFDKTIAVHSSPIEVLDDPSNPYLWPALINKGFVMFNIGQHNEAFELFDQALEIKPDSINILNKKGLMLLELGKYSEALRNFEKALLIDNMNPYVLRNKGRTLREMNQLNDSLDVFAILEKIPDWEIRALQWKTRLFFDSERFDEALMNAQKWRRRLLSFDLPTDDPDAYIEQIKKRYTL